MSSIEAVCSVPEKKKGWNAYCNQLIANECQRITRYCRQVIQYAPTQADQGVLRNSLDAKVADSIEALQSLKQEEGPSAILLNGSLNHHFDVQSLLTELHGVLARKDVVCSVIYNSHLSFVYRIANWLGVRKGPSPSTFMSRVTLDHIAQLSGFRITRLRRMVYCPFHWFGLGSVINAVMPWVPILRHFSLAYLAVLKPIKPLTVRPSLTIVIPARNEAGHIAQALEQLPDCQCPTEVIFVEGHSKDNTWDTIQETIQAYQGPHTLKAYQQSGKGKCDAVRLGFSKASGELLTILDADLTMPPEKLPLFYEAYVTGQADFINGSRLVYPMEGQAMRFLNRLGNQFFANALSWVLDTRISDSLCGTKLVSAEDYERFRQWREDFGDFDPFGDFELLFPAATMGLGIVDIPVRYKARQYGETNISRFRHGVVLLQMTWVAFWKIKMGQVRGPRS